MTLQVEFDRKLIIYPGRENTPHRRDIAIDKIIKTITENPVMPFLYCPIDSRINDQVEAVSQKLVQWACHFGLVQPHGKAYQHLHAAKFAWFAARTYPDVLIDDFEFFAKWATWLWFHDDICDVSKTGQDPEALAAVDDRLLDILRGAEITVQDGPLAQALHNIRRYLVQRTSAAWLNRFIDSVQLYFYGNRQEAANRSANIRPDVDAYIKLSQLAGAVYPCLDLVCIFMQPSPPVAFMKRADVQRLSSSANNIICWHNDIMGFQKERVEGNVNNLVLVLQHQHQLTLQEALNRAVAMCNAEVKIFLNLAVHYTSVGAEEDSSLKAYIKAVKSWLRGHLDWYSDTGRYQVVDGNIQALAA